MLLVFLKDPQPGLVKSRLAGRLGPGRAAGVYRALAEEALRRTRPRGDEFERLLFFAPRESRPRIEEWLPGEPLMPQADGDIGVRMARAFEEAFARGARRAVLVGTDVPSLSRDDVMEAIESLDDQEVVLGPAADGGYYLVALRKSDPGLFEGVPWSTGE